MKRKEHTSEMSQGLMIECCKQKNGKMMSIERLKSVVGQIREAKRTLERRRDEVMGEEKRTPQAVQSQA